MMDAELFDLLIAYLPDSFEGWIGLVIVICAILGAIWPKPPETAYPLWRGLHSLVNAIGLNVRHAKNIQARQKTQEAQGKKTGGIGRLLRRNGGGL